MTHAPQPPNPAPVPLEQRRLALDEAQRRQRTDAVALRAAETAQDELRRAARPRDDDAVAAAAARVKAARQASAAAAAALERELGRLKDALVAHLPPTPEEEVARLAADRPITLLPVRLETRFRGQELLVRVYPDDIFADAHEPELTDAEAADGVTFWANAAGGEENERLAWKLLVDAVGAPRAAWIARQTDPAAPGPVLRRTGAWTRAAEARLLPDRWIFALYKGGVFRAVAGGPVHEPLALTISPDPDAARSDLSDDGLIVDDAVRWTVDFAAAEDAGMAVRIPLTADEAATGLDRLVVVGVKSSLAPDAAAARFGELLDAHRYNRGVAIVPQGTPTNNTTAAPAPFPPADPAGAASFDAERRSIAPVEGRDGGRLMRAFGLPADAAAHWQGAGGRAEDIAMAMARALWPTTLRYFLEQLMAPHFTPKAVELARQFFVGHVRGRGPLAAFRVGNTPYGVLPATALSLWEPDKDAGPLDHELPPALRGLLLLWRGQIPQVPRVGRSGDPDADLLAILGMDASTREVRVRHVLGESLQYNAFSFFGWSAPWEAWWQSSQAIAQAVLSLAGHPDWQPRVARFNFGDTALPFRHPLVSEDPVSERDTLSPQYIAWIRNASIADLTAQRFPGDWTRPPHSLLYRMLRHSALLEYHDASFELLRRYERESAAGRIERELVGLPSQESPARMERFNQVIPQLTGRQPLGVFLANPANHAALRAVLPQEQVVGFRDALGLLAPLATAELERLFTETLDVVSHRIDAWVTGLAAKRLDAMRATRPAGCHIGGYGWVEALRPRPPAPGEPVPLDGGGSAERQSGNGGFVQAPSLLHAAAAAVLRNAYLSRSGPGKEQFAVDLSSARVRKARFVLDAVREGQPLGAVFGYQVERGLHDRHQDVAIDPLRREFALVAGKSGDATDTEEPQEQIAARNVVDGLLMRTAWRENRLTAGLLGLAPGGPAWAAVAAEAAALDEAVDAVADLLLAESIYQIVKGSPSVAAATLDAVAQGSVRPPDPEIATVPRRGTPLTHRVALVLGDGAPALPAGWPAAQSPRAEFEPRLDAWLGTLFGDPATVSCEVAFGPAAAPTGGATVTLDMLGLRPIDLLALARALGDVEAGATQAGASELDRRVRDAAYADQGVADETETRISYGRPAGFDPAAGRTFADVLELARAVEQVLRHSRPLTPADLVSEDRGADADAADIMVDDAIGRATQACARLQEAIDALAPALTAAQAVAAPNRHDLTALRDALRAIGLVGAQAAYPVNSLGDAAELRPPLVAQATSALADGQDRLARALALLDAADEPPLDADPADRLKTASECATIVMGAATPFLPRFRLRPEGAGAPGAAETELDNAIAYSSNAGFVAADANTRARAVRRFEIVAARVRAPLDAWRRLEVVAGLLRRAAPPRTVAQLPYEDGAAWVGLPFADEQHRPKPGRVSLLLYRVAQPAASDPWAGLLLDQWVEQIARPTEQTGITFHYDDPGAEAPQTILLAVPPVPAAHWDLPSLLAVLTETLDLAKVRAVDGELLGVLAQLLPAIYLADSTEDVTVRTDFRGALRYETLIAAAES